MTNLQNLNETKKITYGTTPHWEEFEICGAYEGKVNFLKFGKKLFFCRLLPTRPLQVCKIFMFV